MTPTFAQLRADRVIAEKAFYRAKRALDDIETAIAARSGRVGNSRYELAPLHTQFAEDCVRRGTRDRVFQYMLLHFLDRNYSTGQDLDNFSFDLGCHLADIAPVLLGYIPRPRALARIAHLLGTTPARLITGGPAL